MPKTHEHQKTFRTREELRGVVGLARQIFFRGLLEVGLKPFLTRAKAPLADALLSAKIGPKASQTNIRGLLGWGT